MLISQNIKVNKRNSPSADHNVNRRLANSKCKMRFTWVVLGVSMSSTEYIPLLVFCIASYITGNNISSTLLTSVLISLKRRKLLSTFNSDLGDLIK